MTDLDGRHVDQFQGRDLRHGDVVKVRWPYGVEETRTVSVRYNDYETAGVQNPGQPFEVAKAYLEVLHKGAPALVPLAGSGLKILQLTPAPEPEGLVKARELYERSQARQKKGD